MQAGFYFDWQTIRKSSDHTITGKKGGWLTEDSECSDTDQVRSPDLNASLSGRGNGRKHKICIIWLHFSNTGDCKQFKNNDTRFYVDPFFIVEDRRFQTCPGLTL